MRNRRRAICAAALYGVLSLSGLLHAQAPTTSPPAAAGRIAGRIMGANGAAPVEGATIWLRNDRGDTRVALSNRSGDYEFSGLAPGAYSLRCGKAGYVDVRPGGRFAFAGLGVNITEGAVREGVDVTLARSAVIAVHVTDDLGHPRAGVQVRALMVTDTGGTRLLSSVIGGPVQSPRFWEPKTFDTDDRGDARIYGLVPGDYLVVAEPNGVTLAEPARRDRALIYTRVYYPGTPSPADASVLSLRGGDEVSVTVALAPARAAHISGRVIRWDGDPGRGMVMLRLDPIGVLYAQDLGAGVVSSADLVDGRFAFEDVAPGDYRVETLFHPTLSDSDGVATLRVTVASDDVSDLVLTAVP